MTETSAQLDESGIGIVGVGLIGGSVAAGLRKAAYQGKIVGFGRSEERLRKAQSLGLLSDFATEPEPKIHELSLIVVCTPVDRIVEDVRHFANAARPGTIITDVGSVKESLCRELKDLSNGEVTFVGSHPLAGSEKNGFEHADANLYRDRLCFITPFAETPPETLRRVVLFWSALGMKLQHVSPAEHDRLMSVTSHAPHLIAAAISLLLEEEFKSFTGTGFQDTTRIASGDPGLWRAIMMQNREQMTGTLEKFREILDEFTSAIESGDAQKLEQLLELAKTRRDSLV
ncbi:MAG: prephenate dehydrogenase [Planctomycetaceae bacterium]|nr:prephenate dehydrogenase [Planctomycetaceae bacterium]